jgi:NAD-dependent DNA ligase
MDHKKREKTKNKTKQNNKQKNKNYRNTRAGSMSQLCRQAGGEQEAQANLIVFWHCVHKASANTHHNARGAKTTP